jgi:hypothetical protein
MSLHAGTVESFPISGHFAVSIAVPGEYCCLPPHNVLHPTRSAALRVRLNATVRRRISFGLPAPRP